MPNITANQHSPVTLNEENDNEPPNCEPPSTEELEPPLEVAFPALIETLHLNTVSKNKKLSPVSDRYRFRKK